MRLSRTQLLASLAVLSALTIGVAVTAPWVAKRALEHVARDRGWSIHVDGGRIGWRGIWFDRVELEAGGQAKLHGEFGATRVGWSSLLGTRRVSIGSGNLQLTGTIDQLRELLAPRRALGANRAMRRRDVAYDFHGLDLDWRSEADATPLVSVRQLQLEGTWDEHAARAEALTARHGAVTVEFKSAALRARRDEAVPAPAVSDTSEAAPERKSLRFSANAAEVLVRYDNSAAAEGAKEKGATEGGAGTAGSAAALPKPTPSAPARGKPTTAPKGARVAQATSNSKRELLPALGWLLDEIEELRTELAKSAGTKLRTLHWDDVAIGTSFESPELHLRITDSGQKLDLGPWPFRIERGDTEYSAELSQNAAAGKPSVTAKLTMQNEFESGTLRFAAGPVSLSQLGVTEGDFGLEQVADTRLEVDARAALAVEKGELSVESKGWIERLSIHQPYLARETIKNMGFKWEGAVVVDSSRRQLKTDLLRVSAGAVSARLHGSVRLAPEQQTIDSILEVPLAACQDLFDVLPEGLAPLLRGWRLERNFAMRLSIAFDSKRPDKSKIGFRLDNHCRVASVPLEVAPSRFEQPFVLEVDDETGVPQPTSFGPGTWGWTPLAAISPYVESAVLVCEDGRFLSHDGFDREAIQNSIRENLRTMRFARGASTVSMQLAKNLYLRRDKTIARKLQEAALTMLLEQSFSKRQMLELYLNVIEFGPGIYGIGPAAKHYFATTPDRLTLAQSFFLISILPNPKPSHFGADGALQPGWAKLLKSLMAIAHRRGHFSLAELDAGLEERLAFRVPGNSTIAPTRRVLQDLGSDVADELELPPTPED